MAIQDILNSSWNGEKRVDVRSLLQARLREMVEQLPANGGKTVKGVTLSLDGGNIKLGVTLADGTVKESTIESTDLKNAIGLGTYVKKSDIVSDLDNWGSEQDNSKPLGAGRAKAMNAAIFGLINANNGVVKKDGNTSRLVYNVLPHQVLASMGATYDGASTDLSSMTDIFFFDTATSKIRYKNSVGTVYDTDGPKAGIIYANAVTNKLYLWNGSTFNPVSVEADLSGEDTAVLNNLISSYVQGLIIANATTDDANKLLAASVGKSLKDSIDNLVRSNYARHMMVDDITADASTYAFPTGVTSLWLIEDDTTQDVNIPALVHKYLVDGTVTYDREPVDSAMVYFCRDDRTLYYLNGKHMLDALDVYTTLEVDGLIESIASSGGGVVFVDDMSTEPMTLPEDKDEYTYVLYNDSASTDGVIKLIRNSASQRTPMSDSVLYYVARNDVFYRYSEGAMLVMAHGARSVAQVVSGIIASSVDTTINANSTNAISNKAVATALAAKIDSGDDGRIRYGETALVLLDSMNASPASTPADDVAIYCTDGKIRRGYHADSPQGSVHSWTVETPSPGVVYFHRSTGKAYYWDANNEQMVEFTLSGGGGGSHAQIVEQEVEVTSLGGGTLELAIQRANADSDEMFQWVLKDFDDDGYPVQKIIWHIGDGEFIDALGCPITQ